MTPEQFEAWMQVAEAIREGLEWVVYSLGLFFGWVVVARMKRGIGGYER